MGSVMFRAKQKAKFYQACNMGYALILEDERGKKGYFLLCTVDISLKLARHAKASTPHMVMGEMEHVHIIRLDT